jgi:hypothetical protein
LTQASRRDALIAYLREAADVGDWHAVSDAANDLRVLEAEIAAANAIHPRRQCNATVTGEDNVAWMCQLMHGHGEDHHFQSRT